MAMRTCSSSRSVCSPACSALSKSSVLAAFDNAGNYVGDILVMPANVPNMGADVRWLVGTAAFQTASGFAPEFIMPTGKLPTGGGMVCFGGGGGLAPAAPGSWSRTDFPSYVDCVAYGNYSGPTNVHTGNHTPIAPDGHSIERIGNTKDNAADFACADPATPQNNAGDMGSLPATTRCQGAGPTPTVTVTPPLGPTATSTPTGCACDCNGDGRVTSDELVTAVNLSLGRPQPVVRECRSQPGRGRDRGRAGCLCRSGLERVPPIAA